MNCKILLKFFFVLVFTQSLQAKAPISELSNRLSESDSVQLSTNYKLIYKKVTAPLKGITIVETFKTIKIIRTKFEELKTNSEYVNSKWELRIETTLNVFDDNPAALLSLIWPLFLLFIAIWFYKQYVRVFIRKPNF